MAYWMADSAPFQLLNTIGVFLFCVPVYYISGLRPTVENFFYFAALLYVSMYCNLGLIYFVCMITPDDSRSRLVFSGVLIPIQVSLSGFLILSPTMPVW